MNKIFAVLFIFFAFTFCATSVNAYDPLTIPNNIYGIGIINHTDLEDVSNLVNVNGGDWGYVKIIITEEQRNKEVWQQFLDNCRRHHLIPIIRIASKYEGTSWKIPQTSEIDNWVNFFNSLNWVVENRYIIIGNEPNHAKEWGGKINPIEYAEYLKIFAERLHNASPDYFVLPAGLDQDAPNSKVTMDEKKYIDEMLKAVPDIYNFVDGWNSHSYPNPAFSGPKTGSGRRSIRGYEWELGLVKKDLPVFITETGWVRKCNGKELISEACQSMVANNIKYAFQEVWSKDKRIVAVTPFILNYQDEPFYEFSWKNKDGSFFKIYNEIQNIQKLKGKPTQKISGEVIFSFVNPLILRNSEQKGFTLVKNTGQAIWTQSESNVINESSSEIKISNTKFNQIEPFKSGLVIYTLQTPDKTGVFDIKLGFYVSGSKVGDVTINKIISF